MADYELLDQNGQPRYITKRVRYFDNQLLIDQDFIDEQKYHIDRQRRHERLLHAAGICEGLTVAASLTNQVTISPGTAIDGLGRQILLSAETIFTVVREGALRLYLRFQEEESDNSSKSTGLVSPTRFVINPEIDAVDEASLPDYAIVIATLELTLEGVIVTTEGRTYAGVALPAPTGTTAVELRPAGDDAPGEAVLSGALIIAGTVSGTAITTTNTGDREDGGGVEVGRSTTALEANLRFTTGGDTRWSVRLDDDGTEHLSLASSGGPDTVQRWDYLTGGTTITGDLALEPGSAWLTGAGTVRLPSDATSADTLVGTDTTFQDILQPGDEILLSGDAATEAAYVVREVSSQTGLVLTSAPSPITADTEYTFTYRRNTRKLRFGGSRQSVIELESMESPDGEKGFIRFREAGASVEGDATESGRLTVGIFRDTASGESLDLQGGAKLVLNAGAWDDELDAAIGAPDRTGDAPTLSFRIDDDEKASIDATGKLSVGASYAGTSTATLLSIGPGGKLTADSAGLLSSAGGISVGTGSVPFTVNSSGAVTGASALTVGTGSSKLTVSSAGAISAATGITSSGTVTLTGLSAGSTGTQFVRRGTDNSLSTTTSVNLASGDVTDTLPFARGGTGATNFTQNGLVYGSNTSALGSTAAAASSVLVTGTDSIPKLSQTLPSAVQGNITALGAVTSGSIASGFGSITSTTIDATSALNTGGTTRIDSSGNLKNIAALTASGTITLSGLSSGTTGTKFLRLTSANALSITNSVDLSSSDVTGTTPYVRGGTGATSFTTNGVLYAGASSLGSTGAAASSVLVTGTDSLPTLSQSLPSAVQGNITSLGTVTSGSINTGGSVAAATINATTEIQTGGTKRLDNSGNLTNILALTASSTITFSGLSTGTTGSKFLRLASDNKMTKTDYVDLTADVTGTLPWGKGGTGSTGFTGNGVIYAGSSGLYSTSAAGNSVLITSSGNVPSLSQTLPTAVQGNITALGTVSSGTISGITSVSAGTINATNELQTGGTKRIDSSGNIAGTTINVTSELQTGGTKRIDAGGNLSNIGSITSTGLISTTNSTTGDGVGGVYINRSASDREANLRFGTNNVTKWFLQMDNNSSEDLGLWGSGGTSFVHKWDYETGRQTIYGDIFLDAPWMTITGPGTVTAGSASDRINGSGTSFTTHLMVGDVLTFAGISGTYWVKQVVSDSEVILTSSVTGLSSTGVAWTFGKYSRKLRFPQARTSLIEFNSYVNYGSDKGFILWKDESSAFVSGTSTENGRLSIGVYNDFDSYHGETLDLQGGYQLVLNAGDWDDDLDAAIGTPASATSSRGISLRINNVERALLGAGSFFLNQSGTDECIRMTGNGTSTAPYTIFRNDSNNWFAILRYVTGTDGDVLKAYVQLNASSDWVKASDRSLKENVEPLGNALERLMQLKPVRFDWKAGGEQAMGFIAQDVEETFPELVSTMHTPDGRTLKGFAETGLVPVAIAASQELKREYEARVGELEARIAALEALLRAKGG